MKTLIYLLSFVMLTAMTFSSSIAPGDPIGGADIKGGRRAPGGGQIFATAVTDNKGIAELKGLPALATGERYYVEYGIREQGIKAPFTVYKTADFSNINAVEGGKPIVITEKQGDYVVTMEVSKIKVSEADLAKQRSSSGDASTKGPISTSRSNIKVMVVKSK